MIMHVTQYEHEGKKYLRVVSNSNVELRKMEEDHKKAGRKTWVNPYDYYDSTWQLTVEVEKLEEVPQCIKEAKK